MEKKRIAVLFGGCSDEYEVSLKSAVAVFSNLNPEKYEVIAVGITRDGRWLRYYGGVEGIRDDIWAADGRCIPVVLSPDRGAGGILELRRDGVDLVPVDAVFPVLHGRNGEDGAVQGLLQMAGIPFVGCGVFASAVGMDKDAAHKLAGDAGVAVPKSAVFRRGDDMADISCRVWKFQYPLYVKPANGGSSIGITRVKDPTTLHSAVRRAFEYDDKVIVEENVPGFEVGCAVLGTEELFMGLVDELQLHGVVFDYQEKYQMTKTIHHVPARIDGESAERVRRAALTVYRALGCRGITRIDFFLTPEGEVVFNEVNTMPGLTSGSRYPKMLAAAGLSFGEMLDRLIVDALETALLGERKQGIQEQEADQREQGICAAAAPERKREKRGLVKQAVAAI